jgi:putative endonuclease
MEHIQKGIAGEAKACEYLKSIGYEILAQNYRAGRGEIDIIALHNKCICFIEVKFRKHNKFGYPEAFVTDRKLAMIQQTAHEYVMQKNWKGRIRFDIISITGTEPPLHIMDIS